MRVLRWFIHESSPIAAVGSLVRIYRRGAGLSGSLGERGVEPPDCRAAGAFFGPFRINGEKPKGFESFDFFILGYREEKDADKDNRDALVPDKQGNVSVRGELLTAKGTPLAFETVKLVEAGPVTFFYRGPTLSRYSRAQPVRLSFTTAEVKGIKYAFSGEYLDDPDEENGGYTHLRGTFSKYKNGKLLYEAKTGFKRLAYQELTAEAEQ